MNTKIIISVLSLALITAGCGVSKFQRTSKFTLETIKPGMSQEAVVAAVGKPYKQSFDYTSDSSRMETFYYKEIIWKSNWFEVNNILHFKNGSLTSLEQGTEKHLYEDDKD